MVTDYNHWLRTDPRVPKLYLDPEPGFFAAGIRRTVSSWPNTRKVKCKGLHFVQEDDPDTIGKAVANFVQSKSVSLLLITQLNLVNTRCCLRQLMQINTL